MERIVEMNWFGVAPGQEPQGQPDLCLTLTETPEGDLIQGEACEEPREADIVSSSWSTDHELNGLVNHTRIVRIEE
jgi:hypothetical protein